MRIADDGTTLGIAIALLSGVACSALASCGAAHSMADLTFDDAPDSPLDAGPDAGPAVVADVNGDGHADIVVPCGRRGDAATKELAVFLGDGTGRFRPQRSPIGPMGDGLKLALGDIDHDGALDAIVSEHDSNTLAILRGDGRGRFSRDAGPAVVTNDGSRPHTHSLLAADVNDDTHLDLLATCADEDAVAVLLGDGGGRFTPADGSPFPAGRHPYEGLSVDDLDGDGDLDVVVPNMHGDTVTVLAGDGTGRFAPAPGSPFAVAHRPGFVTVGHLDGDGLPDVVATHDDDPIVATLFGDGRGGLAHGPGSPRRLDRTVWCACVSDLDGDGHNDVALTSHSEVIVVLRGNGRGGFEPTSVRIPSGRGALEQLAVADLDRDGRPDLVTTHFRTGMISVLLSKTGREAAQR